VKPVEEAAQEPEAICRATWRAKGTDTRRLWIVEEVGYRLQEGVPSCGSGAEQEKRRQENADRSRNWPPPE
jgi:hypothetical protein